MIPRRRPTLLFGVPIDDLTMDECLDAIDELVRDGREHQRSHQIATVNVDFLVNAIEDGKLRALLQSTSLNLADGSPLVWGSRLAGVPVRERVAGADLVPLLAAESARRDWRVHFFGSGPGVAERAIDKLLLDHPGAHLTGEAGPMISDTANVDADVLDGLAARHADILCVALGNPKQEWFISANADRIGTPVLIGIGGSLDMLVGDKKRAPRWAQRVGAEWVFRAAQEPRRLGRRYAHDAVVLLPRMLRYVLRLRRTTGGPLTISSTSDGTTVTVTATDASVGGHGSDIEGGGEGLDERASVLDLRFDGRRLSAAALMQLIGLIRRARSRDCTIQSVAPVGEFRTQLERLSLLTWFDRISEPIET